MQDPTVASRAYRVCPDMLVIPPGVLHAKLALEESMPLAMGTRSASYVLPENMFLRKRLQVARSAAKAINNRTTERRLANVVFRVSMRTRKEPPVARFVLLVNLLHLAMPLGAHPQAKATFLMQTKPPRFLAHKEDTP